MKTEYTHEDYMNFIKSMNNKKTDFIYLLNGVSNMTVPKEIEGTLKVNKLYKKVEKECYKSMFEISGTYINNNKCLTSPMNSMFISYRELYKPIRTYDEAIDNLIKNVNIYELYELKEIKIALASLFINLLKDNEDDIGLILEPIKQEKTTKLTLLDPDIIIDTSKNVPIKLLNALVDLGSRYELLVEVHYQENELMNLIDESDELHNWIAHVSIRKKLLKYKEDVRRLQEYILALKNLMAMEKGNEE